MSPLRLSLSALLLASMAFAQTQSRPAQTKPVDAAGMLQGMDEEEFKKMHELRKDQPPPRKGSEIKIGQDRAYLSLPEGKKAPLPAVIVIHEFWGLNEHIEHWCDRLAALGYAALAVDLYEGKVAKDRNDASKFMQAVKQDAAVATMKAAHAFLEKDERVKATKTAALGWCFGGAMALRAGLEVAGLDAVVMYYGRPILDDQLKKLEAPLLGVFGNKDRGIPPEQVDKFEQALKDAGKKATILRYDAQHAFANPSGPAYDQKNAQAAYEQVVKFLGDKLR